MYTEEQLKQEGFEIGKALLLEAKYPSMSKVAELTRFNVHADTGGDEELEEGVYRRLRAEASTHVRRVLEAL